jgi:hypothetical protein
MKLKHPVALLGALGTVVLAMAMAFASFAQAATPAPGYSQFAGCPSPAENAGVTACVRTTIVGGHFQMGSKDVPLTNPMTLSGGLNPETGVISANSKGGLTPVKQTVPGGVVGITGLDWLVNFLNLEALKLYAVTELAGTPRQTPESTLELPIKVHLVNPVLGNNCYVGSTSNPIHLNLTSFTTSPPPPNKPITGRESETSFDGSTGIFHFNNGEFVDNAFSAPGASGCVLNLLGFIPINLNGLVNLQAGLPAKAGTNETRQVQNTELATSETVYP